MCFGPLSQRMALGLPQNRVNCSSDAITRADGLDG